MPVVPYTPRPSAPATPPAQPIPTAYLLMAQAQMISDRKAKLEDSFQISRPTLIPTQSQLDKIQSKIDNEKSFAGYSEMVDDFAAKNKLSPGDEFYYVNPRDGSNTVYKYLGKHDEVDRDFNYEKLEPTEPVS